MEKPKRSYYLPAKLVTSFDADCEKYGYVKERVVAAALVSFLHSSAEDRHRMFDRLEAFLQSKSGDGLARKIKAKRRD